MLETYRAILPLPSHFEIPRSGPRYLLVKERERVSLSLSPCPIGDNSFCSKDPGKLSPSITSLATNMSRGTNSSPSPSTPPRSILSLSLAKENILRIPDKGWTSVITHRFVSNGGEDEVTPSFSRCYEQVRIDCTETVNIWHRVENKYWIQLLK